MLLYLGLIFSHFVADFVCQSDAMAKGKSSNNLWLFLHVLTYMAVMLIPCSILFYGGGLVINGTAISEVVSFPMVVYWLAINGFLHFITDWYTSRWSSKFFAAGDYHNGFVVIGFDQCIHYTCLFVTSRMVIG